MSNRPVIFVQKRLWFYQHVLESEMKRLRDELCVAVADVNAIFGVEDVRVCETRWTRGNQKEVCTCGAYTLEWEAKDDD